VLIIADSRNRAAQQNFASQTPGASTVEAVDLQDLIAFASSFDMWVRRMPSGNCWHSRRAS
jgi:hypothetical protein